MNNLIELKEERAQAIELMQALIASAQTEKRDLTQEEQTNWNQRDARVKDLDKQIEMLERQEELNKRAVKKEVQSPERKIMERFDLWRALRGAALEKLTGAEAEIHQEGVRQYERSGIARMDNSFIIPSNLIQIANKRAIAYVATADGTPPIKTGAQDLLTIVRDELVMDKVGVTMAMDLVGNYKLPSMGQLTAAFVSEETGVDTASTALASDTLAPRRVGSGDIFTKELWAQTNPAIQNQILAEFVSAIYRAVEKDLFDIIAAGGTIGGAYEIGDTVAALSHTSILWLESALKYTDDNTAFVCSPAQRAKLKALALGTSIRFAWDSDNTVNGYRALATAALTATNGGSSNTAFDVIQGNFKGATVGSWGGVELIVDPYTYSANGAYKVTANGLFDSGVNNALHFAVIRNADA